MRARVGSKIGVVTVGVVVNQAINVKTTWFYLARVGWVWLREARFYLPQLFKMSLSFTVDSAIRGHHIYKTIWTPYFREYLISRICQNREIREVKYPRNISRIQYQKLYICNNCKCYVNIYNIH